MAAKTWSRVGGDANWSTGANWNGGTVPATTDTVDFNGTSVLDCTIDALGTWSGGTFTVSGAYTGSITQNVNMVTAAWSWSGNAAGQLYTQAANLTTTTFAFSGPLAAPLVTSYLISGARTFQCTTMSLSVGKVDFSSASSMLCTGAVAMSGVVGLGSDPAVSVIAPAGTWEIRGSFTATYVLPIVDTTYLDFDPNGGTILISGSTSSLVVDVPAFIVGVSFNLFVFTKTGGSTTIAVNNIIPIGANATMDIRASLTILGHVETSGNFRYIGTTSAILNFGVDGGIMESGGTLTQIRATNGSLTLTTGTDIPSTPTLLFDGTVSNVTYTKTSGAILIGIVTVNRTADAGFTIAAGTTADLGANPTCAANLFNILGTALMSGVFTLTHTLSAAPANFQIGAAGVISGAVTEFRLGHGLTFTAGFTIPAGIILTLNINEDDACTVTALTYAFAAGSSVTASVANADFLLASGSIDLGNNPVSNFISGATFEIRGTIFATGTWTITGAAFTLSSTGPGTINAATPLVIVIVDAAFTVQASGVLTGSIGVTMNMNAASGRTFAGGGKTYTTLTRTGASTGTLTITGTNTFTVGIYDVEGLAAHSIIFPNVTTTVAGFFVKGSSGKNVSLIRTGAAGTWTLAKSSAGDVTDVAFATISNSTVDASPVWYAGLTPPSVNGGGNTNWIFTAPPNAGLQRRSAQMVM